MINWTPTITLIFAELSISQVTQVTQTGKTKLKLTTFADIIETQNTLVWSQTARRKSKGLLCDINWSVIAFPNSTETFRLRPSELKSMVFTAVFLNREGFKRYAQTRVGRFSSIPFTWIHEDWFYPMSSDEKRINWHMLGYFVFIISTQSCKSHWHYLTLCLTKMDALLTNPGKLGRSKGLCVQRGKNQRFLFYSSGTY